MIGQLIELARDGAEAERMVLDRAARGLIEHLFGHDERHVGHHAQSAFSRANSSHTSGLLRNVRGW
jgi:hypothetical protein